MEIKNIMVFVVVIVIFMALVNIFVTFIKISEFKEELNGFVFGYVNISINPQLGINVTRDIINWSSGSIDSGEKNATLYTHGDDDGEVLRGNWSGIGVKGFVVENIGSLNVSLSLTAGKNASSLFASSSNTNQNYQWNVSEKEAGSCNGGAVLGAWTNVNITSGGTIYCSQLDFDRDNNEMYVDVLITVPYDTMNIGEQSDTIIITANAAG